MQDNKTVGQLSNELTRSSNGSQDPVELQKEMTKEYCDNVFKAALDGQKHYNHPFYVVVITKREKLMDNVVRSYYFHRGTCPTPDYDQAVFQFDPRRESFQEIWVIPDRDTCQMLYANALEVAPEERELLNYVLDFSSGELFQKALKLNGEIAVPVSDIN